MEDIEQRDWKFISAALLQILDMTRSCTEKEMDKELEFYGVSQEALHEIRNDKEKLLNELKINDKSEIQKMKTSVTDPVKI